MERQEFDFESLNEKIETGSAAGKLFLHVFAALAEYERNVIRERIQAGLSAARARGRVGGRKPLLDEKQKWESACYSVIHPSRFKASQCAMAFREQRSTRPSVL